MDSDRSDIQAIPVHDADELENQPHQSSQLLYQAGNGHWSVQNNMSKQKQETHNTGQYKKPAAALWRLLGGPPQIVEAKFSVTEW